MPNIHRAPPTPAILFPNFRPPLSVGRHNRHWCGFVFGCGFVAVAEEPSCGSEFVFTPIDYAHRSFSMIKAALRAP